MTQLSPRERFLALLLSQPPRSADAIVILAGEDAKPRLEMGFRAFAEGGAPLIVVSGGLDDPPSKIGANALRGALIGKGVSPDRIIVEDASMNTIEQARNVVAMAEAREWKSLILVASSYHIGRALLTFLAALQATRAVVEAETPDGRPTLGAKSWDIRLIPLAAHQSPWSQSPDGLSITREQLLGVEMQKVEEYRERGHCASYEDGVSYLLQWEGKP